MRVMRVSGLEEKGYVHWPVEASLYRRLRLVVGEETHRRRPERLSMLPFLLGTIHSGRRPRREATIQLLGRNLHFSAGWVSVQSKRLGRPETPSHTVSIHPLCPAATVHQQL
jgi:hypothetical protein